MPEPATNSDIILIVIIGTLGMVILALGIVFFFITYQKRLQKQQLEVSLMKAEQQQKLLENTVVSQEKERKRFASDLHDEVGAMLSFIKLNLGRLEKKETDAGLKQMAIESKENLDEVIKQVRRITRDLSPPTLERLGLIAAINEFFGWIDKSDSLQIKLKIIGIEKRLEPKSEIAVFRVIQELVNNAIKYSESNLILVKIKFGANRFYMSVSDNGKGFDIEKVRDSGLGMKNLETRVAVLNGKCKMKSETGKGTIFIMAANN